MKPNFALDFSHDGITLLHRAPSGDWVEVGRVALDDPEMGETLSYLRKTAVGLDGKGFCTKLIIPNSQIRYEEVYAPGPGLSDRQAQIRAALEGLTVYQVDELVWDWTGEGTTVLVAMVPRETLEEAEEFAVQHRFNPVSFGGRYVEEDEEGPLEVWEPFFGPTDFSRSFLGPDADVRDTPAPEITPSDNIFAPDIADQAPGPDAAETDTEPDGKGGAAPGKPFGAGADGGAAAAADPGPAPQAATGTGPDAPPEAGKKAGTDAPDAPVPAFSTRRKAATDAPDPAPAADDGDARPLSRVPHRLELRPDAIVPAADDPAPQPKRPPRPAPERVTRPAAPGKEDSRDLKTLILNASERDRDDPDTTRGGRRPGFDLARAAAGLRTGLRAAVAKIRRSAGPAARSVTHRLRRIAATVRQEAAGLASRLAARAGRPADGAGKGTSGGQGEGASGDADDAAGPHPPGPRLKARADKALQALRALPPARLGAVAVAAILAVGLVTALVFSIGSRPPDTARGPGPDADATPATTAAGLPLRRPAGRDTTETGTSPPDAAARTRPAPRPDDLAGLAGSQPARPARPPRRAEDATTRAPVATTPDTTIAALPPQTRTAPPADLLRPARRPATDANDSDPGDSETGDGSAEQPAVQPAEVQEAPRAPALPTAEEALRLYGETGALQRVERPPQPPGAPDREDIFVAGIDPELGAQDATILPDFKAGPGDDQPPRMVSPMAPGQRFDLDDRGLVRPTPEGVLNPDGVLVRAGRPPAMPPPRPQTGRLLPPDPLAGKRPKPRPADLKTGANAIYVQGRMTLAQLRAFRPRPRPQTVKQQAEQAAGGASELAVPASFRPSHRPSDFASTVAKTRRKLAAVAPTTRTGTARTGTARRGPDTAPASAAPRTPVNTTVAKEATQKNAINLSRLNLIGVYGTASNRRALLRLPSGRYVRVKVGDQVDGGRVAAIGPNSLSYVKGGRNRVLKVPE